jgi:hypothetical protein
MVREVWPALSVASFFIQVFLGHQLLEEIIDVRVPFVISQPLIEHMCPEYLPGPGQ